MMETSFAWELGLRHAAFSKLVSELGRSGTLPEVGEVLANNLKYLIDGFAWRIMYLDPRERLTYESTRGRTRFSRGAEDSLFGFAREVLEKDLPVQMSSDELSADPVLAQSVFGSRREARLLIMPVTLAGARVCVLLGCTSGASYSSHDFQFARLIGESVATRIEHMVLVETLQHNAAHLEQTIATIRSQREELIRLFAPIIEVWEGVAVLVLVGALTRERIEAVTAKVLGSIQDKGTRALLIDVTGALDAECAELFEIIQCARLLGARCAVVGISPRMALALVAAGNSLTGIETHGSLREGLLSLRGRS